MENLDPLPPPNQGWENGALLPSCGARLHPWFERDGGLLFHFILSKIVACSRIWDWVESERANTKIKREETFPRTADFSLAFHGTGHESPRKRITLQLKFGGKFNWGTVLPYLLRKLSGPHVQSKSIVDFGPQRQIYFYNLHSGPAIRTDAGRTKAVKTTN